MPRAHKNRGKAASNPMKTLPRVIKMVFKYYPKATTTIIACIIVSAVLTSMPSIFLQRALRIIGDH